MEKQLKIGKSIIDLLKSSKITDTKIAQDLSVSRLSIYKWKTGKAKHIRSNHLHSLAELLDQEVIDIDGTAELKPLSIESFEIKPLAKESQMGNLETSQLIQSLVENNKDLLNDKKKLREENQYLIKKIDLLDKTISDLSKNTVDMNLDHNRMQFIANMEKQTFVSVTQKYADLYFTDAFNIIKNYKWTDVVHKDDFWRFEVTPLMSDSEMEIPTVWKVNNKEEDFYIESRVLPLDKEGGLKKVDADISTIEKWEESNRFYKNIKSQKEKFKA